MNDKIYFVVDWQIPNENTLNEKLKLTIFRIVQEQLNNIFKHAKASNIIISVKQVAIGRVQNFITADLIQL